jgi:phosphoglycolate phosphatase
MQNRNTSAPRQDLGRTIEIYNPDLIRGQILHAVFDFDGTISLIRAGWQDVMIAQCVGELEQTPTNESREVLEQVCRSFITRLTGEQTIFQMFQLEEEVSKRGGQPRTGAEYKREYLALLQDKLRDKIERLRGGRDSSETYLVRGSIALLEGLKNRGVTCYLASGTDHEFVIDEANLLGLTPFFSGGMYGAQEDYKSFSKKMLIERIIDENQLQGTQLVGFGDGYVEIENTRDAGGLAVGIASLENGEYGWDLWKKNRLLEVGADIMVPDWQEADLLLSYLFGESEQP